MSTFLFIVSRLVEKLLRLSLLDYKFLIFIILSYKNNTLIIIVVNKINNGLLHFDTNFCYIMCS